MARKIRRNDPCPCGSGKKYKNCCLARDKAAQAERVAWERAAQDMRTALIGFARDQEFVRDVAAALGLFWQDRYTPETVHLMSEDEALRFFDWFAHDYPLSTSGKRLIEVYRQEVSDALNPKEAAILDMWIASPPGSAFVLEETDKEETIVIRDLFLERRLTVHDPAAAKHGEVGQILLARPLPEHERTRLSGATVVLPATEEERLREFIIRAYEEYKSEHPEATMAEFLRARAYLFTHYAMEWAEREGRPPVAAQDPEARKRRKRLPSLAARALQKMVELQMRAVTTREADDAGAARSEQADAGGDGKVAAD